MYKDKYLKYKNKYLLLKDQLAGAPTQEQIENRINEINKKIKKIDIICDEMGFVQHEAECWNDALQMILCFSDSISERIQTILYSLEAEEIFDLMIGNGKKFMIPIFLSYNKEIKSEFRKLMIEYLKNLKLRFMQLYNKKKNLPVKAEDEYKAATTCAITSLKFLMKEENIDSNEGTNHNIYLNILLGSAFLLDKKKNITT